MVWRPFMRQMREIVETRSILGTRIRQWMAGTAERCSVSYAKRSFYPSSNAIFGKVGRHASEEVIFQLVKSKACRCYCMD